VAHGPSPVSSEEASELGVIGAEWQVSCSVGSVFYIEFEGCGGMNAETKGPLGKAFCLIFLLFNKITKALRNNSKHKNSQNYFSFYVKSKH
jgi:hypothetical protein